MFIDFNQSLSSRNLRPIASSEKDDVSAEQNNMMSRGKLRENKSFERRR